MRKGIRRALLLALVLALLCIGALAADKASADIQNVQTGYSLTANAALDKFELSYTADSGEQLVMLLKGSATPTDSNIYYIDQKSGLGNFTIYPKQLTTGTYYVVVANTEAKTVATIDYKAAGVPVSGMVTSYGDAEQTVTVSLLNGENVVDTRTGKGESVAYSFESVAEGTYTLLVEKSGHAPYTKEITVEADAVTENVTLYLYGDISADGSIGSVDGAWLARHLAGWPAYLTLNVYETVADLNVDNEISAIDGAILARFLASWPGYEVLPKA
mgnify:CR=1 FL=1